MNLIQRIGLALNRNNYEYIKKEIEKANRADVNEIINNMNPSLIDFDLMGLAIDKGYRFNRYTPKEILNNKEIVLYALEHEININFIINNANSDIITIDLVKKYFDEGKYNVNSSTPQKILDNKNFVKYVLENRKNRDNNEILNNIDASILNDELFYEMVKKGYNIDENTPSYITSNSKYMAYIFVSSQGISSSLQYDYIVDGFKQFLESRKINEKEVSEIFNSFSLGDLLGYIDEFVYQKIDNDFNNVSINLIKNNKDYVKYTLEHMKKNKFPEEKISGFVKQVNPSTIDIESLKIAINAGLKYNHIPEQYKDNIDIISEYISLGDLSVYYDIKDKSKDEIDKIIYLSIDKGMSFDFNHDDTGFRQYVRQNCDFYIYAARKGNLKVLDNLPEINEKIKQEIDEIAYNLIDNGNTNLFDINNDNNTYHIRGNYKYFEYLIDKVNDPNEIQRIIDSSYGYPYLKEQLLKKIIDKGYKFNDSTPYCIKDNIYCVLYAASRGDENALTHLQNDLTPDQINFLNNKLTDELLDNKLFKLIIDKGYIIWDKTPDFIKNNPTYIKIYINSSKISGNNLYWLVDNLDDKVLTDNNCQIFKFLIDKGYFVYPNTKDIFKKNLEIIKYAAHTGNDYVINYLLEPMVNSGKISNEELYSIILSALNNDYTFNFHESPKFVKKMIENNNELLKVAISKQKADQMSFLLEDNGKIKEEVLTKEQLICLQYILKYDGIYGFVVGKNKPYDSIRDLDTNSSVLTLDEMWNRYFKNENLCLALFEEKEWDTIIDMIKTDKNDVLLKKLTQKDYAILKKYLEIDDKLVQEEFMDYIRNNKEQISIDKLDIFGNILIRLATTNSKTLYSMRTSVAEQLLYSDNPKKSLDEIEKLFVKNNIPLFAKMFMCFKILYPEFKRKRYGNFNFSDSSQIAPELKDESLADIDFKKFMNNPSNNDIRYFVLYNDFLRNAIRSNSVDLREYLDNIQLGNYLYLQLSGLDVKHNYKFDKLSNEIKEQALKKFVSHLETIYRNSKDGKNDKIILDNLSDIEKIKYLRNKIKPTSRYDLPDRIIRMYCYSAGYTSFKQIKDEMKKSIEEAHKRNVKLGEYLEGHSFIFEDGDFIRGIGDYNAFSGSIDIGNYCKEHLTTIRYDSTSDSTELDTDFSRIKNKGTIYNSIKDTRTGFTYGNIYLIMKNNNPNINITRDEFNNLTRNKYDPKKIEMFRTCSENHWGVRTGFSLTDVDLILYKKTDSINDNCPYDEKGNVNYIENKQKFDDLSRIKFEIVRHGYYIPIIDFSGKLIFTVTEYEKLRSKMNGLSYYEIDEYEISNNLDFNGIDNIISKLDDNREDTVEKRNNVYDILKTILSGYNLSLKTKIDGDLTPGSVEVIDTGSTGRETNNIGSGDFDLLLRVDQVICRDSYKYRQFKESIKNYFQTKYRIDEIITTDSEDYRMKGVHIDDNTIVDIDLSFTVKTDKITYSTDECLKDRLNTIKEQDYDKYQKVLANIIIAKKFMKKYGCYKPYRSDNKQGGMGGSGIENWILQNEGSFIDAVKDFYEVAKDKDYNEFRKEYFVWDFGQNHFAERKGIYPYDNFIDNMSQNGYDKMKNACKEILLNIDNIYDLLNDNKGISKIA